VRREQIEEGRGDRVGMQAGDPSSPGLGPFWAGLVLNLMEREGTDSGNKK
jgi:hypothetical protein